MMVHSLNRMSEEKKEKHLYIAGNYLDQMGLY